MPQAAKAEKPPLAKPKRTLSEDQLAKLKVARERALEVKKAMKEKSDDAKIKHYEEKIMKIKGKNTDKVSMSGMVWRPILLKKCAMQRGTWGDQSDL